MPFCTDKGAGDETQSAIVRCRSCCGRGSDARVFGPQGSPSTPVHREHRRKSVTYQFVRPKWKPGTTLNYVTRCLNELRQGDQTTSEQTAALLGFFAVRRTSQGYIQVNLSENNRDLGFVLYDEQGLVADVVAPQPPRSKH